MILFTVSVYPLTKLAIILYNVFIYMSKASFSNTFNLKYWHFIPWFFMVCKCALRKIIWIYFRFSIWLLLSSSRPMRKTKRGLNKYENQECFYTEKTFRKEKEIGINVNFHVKIKIRKNIISNIIKSSFKRRNNPWKNLKT